MKNRLYFILFFVYVIVGAVVFYVNGVFSGEVSNMMNLLINGGFLLIIGVLFVISTISFGRLNACTDELQALTEKLLKEAKEAQGKSLWNNYQDKKDLFETEGLKTAYQKYRMRMKSLRTKRGYIGGCELEEFINEDLLDRVSMSYFNSGMAGMLTGLGILGTFLGLSIGLGSFNGNDIYAVTDNVGTLLGGMKVAFHTSVYGILFSLMFTIVYRSLMADAYEKLNNFLDAFHQCVVPPSATEDENTAVMMMYQANMSNSLKQLLDISKGESQAQLEGVSLIVDRFVQNMEATLGGSLSQIGAQLQDSVQAQKESEERFRELEKETIAVLKAQKQSLANLEALTERIQAQEEQLANTCNDISNDISNQLYTYEQIRGAYEK